MQSYNPIEKFIQFQKDSWQQQAPHANTGFSPTAQANNVEPGSAGGHTSVSPAAKPSADMAAAPHMPEHFQSTSMHLEANPTPPIDQFDHETLYVGIGATIFLAIIAFLVFLEKRR